MRLDVVERHSERDLLVDATTGKTWTYAEAHALARGIADALSARGIRAGNRVALELDDRPELLLHYLGCLYLGVTAVPIPPTVSDNERSHIVQTAQPDIILDQPLHVAPLPGAATEVDESALFTITFTSGTASDPKGVAHTAGSMLLAATAFARALSYGSETRLLHVLPMSYMAGILNTILCPFVAGGTIVLGRTFDATSFANFWDPVLAWRVNTLWTAPPMLAGLLRLDRDERGPDYARTAFTSVSVGTAPLAPAVRDAFERRYGVQLFESYGLSELLFVSTGSAEHPNPARSAGRVLPEVEVQTAADGELLVRTPFAMAGYLDRGGQPEPPEEWFTTGDLGHVDAARNLYVTGRKKDLIIRAGANVSPRAVEDVLEAHEAVARAAVIGAPHELLGEEVVAVVQLHHSGRIDDLERSLAAFCRARLPVAAVPSRFIEVALIPLGPTGKVRKEQLRATIVADTQ